MIAAIYARKSTEQNVSDDAKSVTRQVDNAKAFALSKGWIIDERFIFVDDGVSGAEFDNRPGFVALMSSLKTRPFQVLIMSEESRLGRSTDTVPDTLGRLVRAGVEVWYHRDGRKVTLDTPMDKFMVSATSFASDMERWLAQQRTAEAMLQRARQGFVTPRPDNAFEQPGGYDFEAQTRFDRLFAGVAAPTLSEGSDLTGTEGITAADTWDADYARLLERAQKRLENGDVERVASPPGFEPGFQP